MQKFPNGRAAPTFFTTGAKTDFDNLRPRNDSWLTNWTRRCLGVSLAEARALLEPVIRALSEGAHPPLVRWSSNSDASVFGLAPERIVLVPLSDGQLHSAQLRCPECLHIQPTAPARAKLWQQAPCPRMHCDGRLEPHPVRSENYYRGLYRSGRLRRLVTHEHTALLGEEARLNVERGFAGGESAVDPNVLTCTPTLELGIDIGDLSSVGLASLPRSPANYLQRVGRAGRATGNAYVLATVPSSARDLYYLAEPKDLIDGEVTPPAAYLAATELLCRQYLAFCMDRVAAGELRTDRDMPRLLGVLFEHGLEEGTWLRQFLDTVTARAGELAERFLALYGDALDEPARESVRGFAAGGLREALALAVRDWFTHREELQRRLGELAESIAELDKQGHLDDAQREDHRRWTGESKALSRMLHESWSQNALTGLGELSLLPSYNLRDDRTDLDVSLWWTTDDEGESELRVAEEHYGRPSRTALTEFAPGAVFYARGYRVEIDAVEIGPAGQPHWRHMRLCPDCGWGDDVVEPAPQSCPRCASTAAADTGAVHKVLELRRVSAVHRRDEAIIEDEADERTRVGFTQVTGIDVAPKHIARAWRLAEQAFGAEYVRQATIRTINVGRRDRPGADIAVAGMRETAARFPTCAYCGVVRQGPEDKVRHRGWCSTRRGSKPAWEELLLSHEITTQAVRLLLPVSTFHVVARLACFKTALLLGLHRDFGGDPQHLEVVTAQMPDEHGRVRRFLVLHDTVPGGTGYLDRFGDPERMRRILTQARDVLAACECQADGLAACHRCLLGVAAPAEVQHVSRARALELCNELLADWRVEEIGTVTGIDISNVQLSELELRFREQLKRAVDTDPEQSWSGSVGNNGEELDIRLLDPDGGTRRWTAKPLVQVRAGAVSTEPDFLLTRQDAQDAPVAVYLDGKAYHASPEVQRTADDARKRAALRDDGYRVWSLTWEDVEDYARMLDGHESGLSELVHTTLRRAVLGQVSDRRVAKLWDNPMAALLAYLQAPQAAVWGEAALHTCLGLLGSREHRAADPVPCTAEGLTQALETWALGEAPAQAAGGTIVLARTAGVSGLPIAVVGSATGTGQDSIGAATMLDDRPSEVGGSANDRQWRDWLRWANLLQFLPLPGYGAPMPLRMAECWTRESQDVFRGRPLPLSLPAKPMRPAAVDVAHPQWDVVIEYTDECLAGVGRRLANLDVPDPEAGGEVGDSELWQVEYCWPDERIAVVIDIDEPRDAWLAANGWRRFAYPGQDREEELVQAIAGAFGVQAG